MTIYYTRHGKGPDPNRHCAVHYQLGLIDKQIIHSLLNDTYIYKYTYFYIFVVFLIFFLLITCCPSVSLKAPFFFQIILSSSIILSLTFMCLYICMCVRIEGNTLYINATSHFLIELTYYVYMQFVSRRMYTCIHVVFEGGP